MKSEENHGCRHCAKSFSSPKALYGHMRLHSDRPWRGMQPPTPAPIESLRPLPSWIVTAKRGRTMISTDSSSSASSSGTSSAGSVAVNGMREQSRCKIRKIKTDQLKGNVSLDSVISTNHEHQAELKNMNCPKKLFRCNSCDREFTSHQALGGHKSRHNKTTTVSGWTERQPSQRRKIILDFDLNELPPVDKEE